MTLAFSILTVQALLGAFDNLWHHELEARLPARVSARRELAPHAVREALYGALFLALAWGEWHGAFALGLALILAVEVAVTLADFIEEDMTRRLPKLERVLHTVLAVSYGGFLVALAPTLAEWAARPTAVLPAHHGAFSWFFTLGGVAVLAWSVRNAVAAVRLHRQAARARVDAAAAASAPSGGGDAAVLVTGGTGFIGAALVRELLAEGRRVILLTRDPRQAAAGFGPRVVAVEGLDAIPSETRIGAVVNLAGAPVLGGPWTRARRRVLLESRLGIDARRGGAAGAARNQAGVLVNASAVGFYGARAPDEALAEDAAPRPGEFQSDLCAAWEAEAFRARDLGVRVVALRFGLVLGHGGGSFPPLALAARLGLGATLGDGRQPAPWLHLADAVGLVRFAMAESSFDGAVNAVAPEAAMAQRGFAAALARACGRPFWLRVPAAPLRAALGEMSDLLLAGQRAVPARALAARYRFRFPTLQGALADLLRPAAAPTPPAQAAPTPRPGLPRRPLAAELTGGPISPPTSTPSGPRKVAPNGAAFSVLGRPVPDRRHVRKHRTSAARRAWKRASPTPSRPRSSTWATSSCACRSAARNGRWCRSWPTAPTARPSGSRTARRSATRSARCSTWRTRSAANGRWRCPPPASTGR